ncbi:hypothetical protein LVD17_20585 [Fulvivirga ulvae]|uniref:hypothetical protein n=1 Tax=Fulvivirga ulvae TaxID=2904245 RepID=UPI001F1F6F33|nr:hypothetical protein [Fulvivirga ulvae]UII30694.1 hypothetical protein LVD17_20585 [Fulvivirga ulvae]
MDSHQSQQQQSNTTTSGSKPDNLQRDNLSPSSKTPNLTGRAGFVPRSLSGAASEGAETLSASEILQMIKIDYSSSKEAQERTAFDNEAEVSMETTKDEKEANEVRTDPEIKALIRSIKESIFKLRYNGDYANRHLNFEQNWKEDAKELQKELDKIENTSVTSCDALSNLKERAEYSASESTKNIKAMILAKELLIDLKSIKAELFSINAWQMANKELSKRLKGKDLLGFDKKMVEARSNLQILLNKIDHNEQLKTGLSKFKLGDYLSGIKKHANAIIMWTSNGSALNIEAEKIIKLLKAYRF